MFPRGTTCAMCEVCSAMSEKYSLICSTNMAARSALKFPKELKELRLHLCQSSAASKGVRDFIETHYVGLKTSNPKFPILIRECSGVQPRLYARYDFGKESSISLANLKAEDVLKQVERLSKSY